MPDWHEIPDAKALQPGEMVHSMAGTEDVLVLNEGGDLRAYLNRCGHMNVPLDLGTLKSGVLMCAQHNACFDARSGAIRSPPVRRPLPADALPKEMAAALQRTEANLARVICKPLTPLPMDRTGGTVRVFV